MAKRIAFPFAEDGDKIAIPDAVQVDGQVSYEEGYGFDYQRPIGSGPLVKEVPRQKMNQLFFDITDNLKNWQLNTFPEWYAATTGGYALLATVKHSGIIYQSLIAGNTNTPPHSSWAVIGKITSLDQYNNFIDPTTPLTADADITDNFIFRSTSIAPSFCSDSHIENCGTLTSGVDGAVQTSYFFDVSTITVSDGLIRDSTIFNCSNIILGSANASITSSKISDTSALLGTDGSISRCVVSSCDQFEIDGSISGSLLHRTSLDVSVDASVTEGFFLGTNNIAVTGTASVTDCIVTGSTGITFSASVNGGLILNCNTGSFSGASSSKIFAFTCQNSVIDGCYEAGIISSDNTTINSCDATIVIGSNRVLAQNRDNQLLMGYAASGSADNENINIKLDAQTGELNTRNHMIMTATTTNASATRAVFSESSSATPAIKNQPTLADNSAFVVEGQVIARSSGGDVASWDFKGAIKRGAGVGTTALVAAITPTVIAADAGAATWTVAVTADTTLGCLALTVTGAAATTINWRSNLTITKV